MHFIANIIRRWWPKRARLVQRETRDRYHVLGMPSTIRKEEGDAFAGTYSVRIRKNAWERMGEITPGRDEYTTRRRRKTRVTNDLKECQAQASTCRVACDNNTFRPDRSVRGTFWRSD